MNISKERKKVEKLNGELIDQLCKALSLKQTPSGGSNPYDKARINFEVTREITISKFLRKDIVENRTKHYQLLLRNKFPYITFLNYWGDSALTIFGEDFREDEDIKLKWVMYAIKSYTHKQRGRLCDVISQTKVLEDLLKKVNALI